jgi:arylsulfatase A-like enzyme
MQPGAFFDKIASRDDYPNYAAGLSYFRKPPDGTPVGVNLPTYLMEGPLLWPGQHAGFLGPKYDVMQVTQDPNRPDFKVDNLRPTGMDVDQLKDRMALLAAVNDSRKWLSEAAETKKLTDQQRQAVAVLTSGRVAKAFEIDREPAAVRDKYGRHAFGQSCLLARRLIEAGVPVVQANMGRVQNWDSHGDLFKRMKKDLLPPLDAGVSALLDEMSERGLLEDTMVMVLGEFGREPKINKGAGREHWAPCFCGLFAGAGVRGGQVIGKSDKTAAHPATTPYSPDDIGATVYSVLGIDPHAEVADRLGRPVQLNRGRVIAPLFDGTAD